LGKKDLARLEAKGTDLTLEQFDLFGSLVQQFINDLVDIDLLHLVHDLFRI
jgi:hypothetical protein